jgi:hypothetical protein
MSETVEIKIRIDAQKKEQYDAHVAALNVSRSARVKQLIDADLEGRIAAERVLPERPTTRSTAEILDSRFEHLISELTALFKKNRETMSTALSPLKTVASIALTEKRFNTSDEIKRGLVQEVHSLREEVKMSAEISSTQYAKLLKALKVERPEFIHDTRMHTGFIMGFAALLLLMAVLPGSWFLSQGFAKLALGERDAIKAGAQLAGQGRSSAEQAIISTSILSRDPAFMESYYACVRAANDTDKRTTCTLSMPGLK